MKIAMMVRGYLPAPRPSDMIYAPIDLAIAISDGLTRQGHSVTFFGPNGTQLQYKKAKVETLSLRPLVHNQQEFKELLNNTDQLAHYVPALWDKYLATEIMRRAERGQFDLVYFHHPEVGLDLAKHYPSVPIVYTLHDPIYAWYKELFELYSSPNQHFISISKNQRRDAPDLPYIATVYNGIDPADWPLCTDPEDYLLCGGRIMPDKGIKEAIQVAKKTGKRLLIIGPTSPGLSQEYFDQYINPELNDRILYLGFIEREKMSRYYQKAAAFLTPIQWEEPFGLTAIEAMACGTPVISLKRGAVPEIVKHGKTGFVVESIADMAACVEKLDQIDRTACRQHVIDNFSTDKMVAGYESAFKKVLRAQTSRQKVARDLNILKLSLMHLPQKLKDNLSVQNATGLPSAIFERELRKVKNARLKSLNVEASQSESEG